MAKITNIKDQQLVLHESVLKDIFPDGLEA